MNQEAVQLALEKGRIDNQDRHGPISSRAGLRSEKRRSGGSGRRSSGHLFDLWAEVAPRLRAAKHLTLLLDFDGTLVPLRRRPEEAWLDDSVRNLLRWMAHHSRVKVWIISGRRRADLQKRVNVAGIRYAGLHGWERDARMSSVGRRHNLLLRVKRQLAERLGDLPHIWIEDKELSYVVHYRGASSGTVRQARAVVAGILKPFESALRVLEGKKVWEVLPKEVKGKGEAVRAILKAEPNASLPIYVGDDTTDESAFTALRRGFTVRVGLSGNTKARFRLRNPREVRTLLERLKAEFA